MCVYVIFTSPGLFVCCLLTFGVSSWSCMLACLLVCLLDCLPACLSVACLACVALSIVVANVKQHNARKTSLFSFVEALLLVALDVFAASNVESPLVSVSVVWLLWHADLIGVLSGCGAFPMLPLGYLVNSSFWSVV